MAQIAVSGIETKTAKEELHLMLNRVALMAALVGLLLVLGGCDDDGSQDVSGEPGPTATSGLHNGDTNPKTEEAFGTAPSTLAASDPLDAGAYSRFAYYFIEVVPGYDVRYVDQPTDCSSGEPVVVEGEAFIQVTFTPARDHNDDGVQMHLPSPDDADSLPAVGEIVQTCDTDEQLSFVFGVVEPELDFRVFALTGFTNRETILLDIENP